MVEREVKLQFRSPEEARAAISRPGPPPFAPAGFRRTRSSTPPTSVAAARAACCAFAPKPAQKPADRSRAGAARDDEDARGVRNRRSATAKRSAGVRAARAARLVPLREVPRGIRRPEVMTSRSTKLRSAPSSRSKGARTASSTATRLLGRTPDDFILDSIVGSSCQPPRAVGSTAGDMVFATTNDSGARPDGRSGHSPASTVFRSRQGCNARRRRADRAADPAQLSSAGVTDAVLNLHHLPHTITASSATAAISACASGIRGRSRYLGRPAARDARFRCCELASGGSTRRS